MMGILIWVSGLFIFTILWCLIVWFKKLKPMALLQAIIFIVFFVGLLAVSMNIESIIQSNGPLQFCMTSECVKYAASLFSSTIELIKFVIGALFFVFAFGGFLISIGRFNQGVRANALNVHISYLQVFQEYVNSEVLKKSKVSASSVNVLDWYNTIFRKARLGDLSVSNEYVKKIKCISDSISNSNNEYSDAESAKFNFREHQTRIIRAFKGVGITVTRLPRTEFYQVEDQVVALLNDVNSKFISEEVVSSELPKRAYL